METIRTSMFGKLIDRIERDGSFICYFFSNGDFIDYYLRDGRRVCWRISTEETCKRGLELDAEVRGAVCRGEL